MAITSANRCASDARCLSEMLIAASANIALAVIAPATQPATWAGMYTSACRHRSPPKLASTRETTGLKWAPETAPNIKMIVNSAAAVAAAFSSS